MSQAGPLTQFSSGPGTPILYLKGDTGGDVGADPLGVILLEGSANITTTGDPPNNKITFTVGGLNILLISVDTALANNITYICVAPGANLICTLPAVSPIGSRITVALDGATSFTIAQGASQVIVFGNQVTTPGVAGSLKSTQQGDVITMVCVGTNLRWLVLSGMGNEIVT